MKSSNEIQNATRKFVEYWTFQRGSEKGEDQQFWNSLLRDVLVSRMWNAISSSKYLFRWRRVEDAPPYRFAKW